MSSYDPYDADIAIEADLTPDYCRKCRAQVTKKTSYFCPSCEARFCRKCYMDIDLLIQRNFSKHIWECTFCMEERSNADGFVVYDDEETGDTIVDFTYSIEAGKRSAKRQQQVEIESDPDYEDSDQSDDSSASSSSSSTSKGSSTTVSMTESVIEGEDEDEDEDGDDHSTTLKSSE